MTDTLGYRFADIDLSKLPPPNVVQPLDYATILQDVIAEFLASIRTHTPDYPAPTISEPVYHVLAAAAYRELLARQRINDAARALLVAFARGADLDHIGARRGMARLLLDAGNPEAAPPVPPTHESDDAFRRRIALAPEALSVAGPEGGYIFQALTAGEPVRLESIASPIPGTITLTYRLDPSSTAARVKGISAETPAPGEILVTVLSRDDDGTPEQDLLDAVITQLSARHVRPLGDHVTVQGATIVPYTIQARLWLYPGPGEAETLTAAQRGAETFAVDRHALGRDITRSTLFAALAVPGAVQRIEILSPAADLEIDSHQAAYCTSIDISIAGRDE